MAQKTEEQSGKGKLKEKLFVVIFQSDTPAGKAFDVILLILISLSVIVVLLETVPVIIRDYRPLIIILEWIFTIAFTIEYLLRLYCVRKPMHYATSFYGVIDLLAILPTYLSLIIPGSQYFLTLRIFRLLRIFRIFKLGRYLVESDILKNAMIASRPKIIVFLMTVISIVIIIGSAMYVIEGGPDSGFTSIPASMYWAIVTLTTVGFGDITPITPLGKFLASILMITGYAIIAVPTGIVTVELAQATNRSKAQQVCANCGLKNHDVDANFCKNCGNNLK